MCDLPRDEKPYELSGWFYHSHKNEEKYHRNEFGGWSCNDSFARMDLNRPRTKAYAFVRYCKKNKCDMVFPLKCRGYYTVEQVLAAQAKGYSFSKCSEFPFKNNYLTK